jgi:hypothetical protein
MSKQNITFAAKHTAECVFNCALPTILPDILTHSFASIIPLDAHSML